MTRPPSHRGLEDLVSDPAEFRTCVARLDRPLFVLRGARGLAATHSAAAAVRSGDEMLALVGPGRPGDFGDPGFGQRHGCRLAYAAGAMADGISGTSFVTAMGRAGLLSSFGAAGLPLAEIEAAITAIRHALPSGPWAFNLIHSPTHPGLEAATADLYLRRGVDCVEASAFMGLTGALVRYRCTGLQTRPDGRVRIPNRLIAKVSRSEVATPFLSPPPDDLVRSLVRAGELAPEEARLAQHIPMADDLTIEADSGGHTDGRPLLCALPEMMRLRDRLQQGAPYRTRVGAAGGIGTPEAIVAAFAAGAAYVVTGSINQSCVEAATSHQVKALLAEAGPADVIMAPAADMFEIGAQVQVLKRGTLYGTRARKLHALYRAYPSLEALPSDELERLEHAVWQRPLAQVCAETARYFQARNPSIWTAAQADPHRMMALVFCWYLGQSSQWAREGRAARLPDYQIWCGPAMGSFNAWARGSAFEAADRRRVVDVAHRLMEEAALLSRVHQLRRQGLDLKDGPVQRRVPRVPEPVIEPKAAPAVSSMSKAGISEWLTSQIADAAGLEPEMIDPFAPFESYAIDSAKALVVLARLRKRLDRTLPATLFWNYPCIDALSERLARMAGATAPSVPDAAHRNPGRTRE